MYYDQQRLVHFLYGHLDSIDVKIGDKVTAGQDRKSGDTGNSSGPHLHLRFVILREHA